MLISEFDYELPEELIAQAPLPQRDESRMMVLDRQRESCTDARFASLPNYVQEKDVLVINNTRVFPARLLAQREPTGGRVEILLIRELEPLMWEVLVRPGNRIKKGACLKFGDARLQAEVIDMPGNGLRRLRFDCDGQWDKVLEDIGQVPLPPYIRRPPEADDRERYQTLFAREIGAIAAPTAGLHFTPEILAQVKDRGTKVVEITLHVGYGTFEPVRVDQIDQHRVGAERFEITEQTAQTINDARALGGRVIAVGTTTTRALEAASNSKGRLEPTRANAEVTIIPGFKFRATDALLTNFHLPRSSLLLLVSAFAGREFVLQSYRRAVELGYRFYSYGDCMLVI